MDDQGPFDDDPVLSRRERLRVQREAAHRAPTRVGLRFTAAATVVVGLLVWLAVSWLTSSPSASEQPPEDPTLRAEPGPGGGSGSASGSEAGGEATTDAGEATASDPESADATRTDPPSGSEAPETSATAETPAAIVVHVAGAVVEPGVVELPPGARVRDAVEAAGGLTEDAAAEGINLAAEAVDGGYLRVPTLEELESGETAGGPAAPGGGGAGPSGGAGGGAEGTEDAGPIDLNRADAETLQGLTGIGPALAERILEHRETAGPFESLEDLAGVRGIGPATLEDLEGQVTW
ncbi:ComEA family DNA-binding protein [Nesterenkonia halobia]|uniref:ComEA family DNA-binding protein n=1 Tax=Nesterenkonia halobia TaxID=37922 RepID=A0ABP6RFW3_9MICC